MKANDGCERKKSSMSITHQYRPQGVCAQAMNVTLSDTGCIENVEILGGCNGNLTGISALVKGMEAQAAIARMEGIRCGFKATSCPDQLCKALRQALALQQG